MSVAQTSSLELRNGAPPFYTPGSVVAGRYRVVRSLGHGGMASVYLAEDEVLGKTEVAIKILQGRRKEDAHIIQRFIREVQLTHRINHENVVRTFDFGRDGDTIFYSMEFLQGAPLDAFVEEGCTLQRAVQFANQIVRGLDAVHNVGVIHRDLKPANIIVTDAGILKITDFGVAKASSAAPTAMSSDVMGTVSYVAPEVLRSEPATKAVDYYALGVILYELLTGAPPFGDENPARIILRKLEEDPVPVSKLRPDVPEWLVTVITGLLERVPELRVQAMLDLRRNLKAYEQMHPAASVQRRRPRITLREQHSEIPKARLLPSSWRGALSIRMLLVILCALVAIPIHATDTFTKLELDQLDTLFRLRGPVAPHPDLVVVALDEQSYSNMGVSLASPWPRALHAQILNVLSEAGAKRVVFDVIFSGSNPENHDDQELGRSMARVPTVLGAALGFTQKATANGAFLLEELIQPDAIFERESIGIGVVGLPQHFGRVRDFFEPHSEVFPNLSSLAEMAVMLDRTSGARPALNDLINFYGPSKTVPTIPYEIALAANPKQLKEIFRGKIVFVGLGLKSSTGPAQRDAFTTPFDGGTYGIEIHATIASNLLNDDWIRQPPLWMGCVWNALVAAAIAFLLLTSTGAAAVIAISGLIAAVFGLQFILFLLGCFLPVLSGCLWGLFSGVLARVLLVPDDVGPRRGGL